ncbi:MAG TPA: T9SS type A sorting domain-containing protein, partial [Chitinophagales bacterium]|nr:T9SS type A sorting domain-containing protein [Chitinophagales bacterium]
QAQPATLHLYDLTGRLLFNTTLQPTAGINSYVLDMTRYPQGMYVVTLNNGAEVVTGKVVRE